MKIFDENDPLVLSGVYDCEGFTPQERKALDRKRRESEEFSDMPDSHQDQFGVWRCSICGRVQWCEVDHSGG